MTQPGTGASRADTPRKAEIEATGDELGQTLDELAARLDVPARAKRSLYRARDTAVDTCREKPPVCSPAPRC